MEMTEGQKSEIKAAFKKRRNRQLMVSVPVACIIFVIIFLEDRVENGEFVFSYGMLGMLWIVSCFAVLLAIAFSIKNWRCPACDKYLGKSINPKYCSKCGAQLQ